MTLKNTEKTQDSFEIGGENNSTSKVVRLHLSTYNKKISGDKNEEARIKSETEAEDVYNNSRLKKTKENEKEIERHRTARKRSGKDYNSDKNEISENEEVINASFDSVSLPFFFVAVGFVSIFSFLYGKTVSQK